jgi:hypothetical protein
MSYIGILIKFARVFTSEGLDIESAMKRGNAQSTKTVKFSSRMYGDKTDYIVCFRVHSNASQNFGDETSSSRPGG